MCPDEAVWPARVTASPSGLQALLGVSTPTLALKANGCQLDGQYILDADMTARSPALSSVGTPFTARDVGKVALVVGAGAPTSIGTTSAALATGAAITAIPVNALAAALPAGNIWTFSADGTQKQQWSTTGAAAAAVSIPVTSQIPNFAYAAGSTVGYPECLSTAINSVAAGVATLATAAAVTVTAATACYGTDDTAAVNAVIDTLGNNGQGGIILAEDGVYCIAGALKTAATSGNNIGALTYRSQLTLPAQNISSAPKLVIVFEGGKGAGGDPGLQSGVQAAGAIFQSFLVGQGAGGSNQLPSMLGGPSTETPAGASSITNVHCELRNLTLRCPSNPSITAANLQATETAATRDIRVDTTEVAVAYVAGAYPQQPVHRTGLGLVLPAVYCQNGRCHGDLFITGYYGGLRIGEHSQIDYAYILECYAALAVVPVAHASVGTHINVEHCAHVLGYIDPTAGLGTIGTGTVYLYLSLLDIEDTGSTQGPQWALPVDHINDPQNRINGKLNFHRVVGAVGPVAIPTSLTVVTNNKLVIENDGQSIRGGGIFSFVTTAQAAGGAAALPATPALYFTVQDPNGAVRRIPAY